MKTMTDPTGHFEKLKAQALALDKTVLDDPVRREPVRRAGVTIIRDLNILVPLTPKGDPLLERIANLGTAVGIEIFRLPAPPTRKPIPMEDA